MNANGTRLFFVTALSLGAIVLVAGSATLWSVIRDGAPEGSPTAPAASNITPSATPSSTSSPVQPATSGSIDQLIDTTTGRAIELWAANESGGGVHFSADGRWMAYSSGSDFRRQNIHVLDLASPALQPRNVAQGVTPQLSPDNPLLAFATGAPDSRIQVHHLTTPGTVGLEPPGQQPLWSPDGRWLTYWSPFAAPPEDRTLYLVDRHGWTVRTIGTAYLCQCGAPYGPFWSPDGRWLYYPYSSDRQPALIDPVSLARTPIAGYPYWAPKGTRFITLDQQSMTLHSGPSDAGVPLVEGQRSVHSPQWSPDGMMVTYEDANAGITAISTASGQPLWQMPGFSLGWSADGGFFVSGSGQGNIRGFALTMVRSSDGARVHTVDPASGAAWSPKEPVLAFTRVDASACNRPDNPVKLSLHLFDARTGEERLLLQGVESICRGSRPIAVWAPDGRYLALCRCGGL